MKAWKVKNQENVTLDEFTLERKEGEVKVKISKALISSTDICALKDEGMHILVPCHSAVGYVSESDTSLLKFGTRVVVSPFVEVNDDGKKRVETMGVNRDGFLQDFINLPERNVYAVPEGLSIKDEDVIFAEYIATAINVLEAVDSEKGNYIVVAGASTLGLIIAQIAIYYQLVPILVDLDSSKLELAKSLGIYYMLNPTFDNLEEHVKRTTGARMCDAAIIAGEGVALRTVPYLVKDEGQIVVCGYNIREKGHIETDVVLKKQLKIVGVNNGYGEMPSAINLLANKVVKTEGLINHTIDFKDFPSIIKPCIDYPYQYNKILIDFD
ncbi:MAG: zinc-binding dehydrogenase [Clostridia bacterium]|nr:zinc-binding dehydrogenase [Clostridia bacterium]